MPLPMGEGFISAFVDIGGRSAAASDDLRRSCAEVCRNGPIWSIDAAGWLGMLSTRSYTHQVHHGAS